MLDSHPLVAVPFESHFIPPMLELAGEIEADPGREIERYCDALESMDRFRAWELPIETVEEAIRRDAPPHDVPQMLRATYRAWANIRGKARYADKTPEYALAIRRIAAAFDEARFVHLIRDGRNVACSYLDTGVGPDTIEGAAVMWSRHVESARAAGGALGPSRYLEMRYERLVDDPETELRRLCALAEIAYTPSMLEYPANAASLLAGAKQPHAHSGIRQPPQRGMRDFRRELSAGDLFVFESRVGPLLTELGYVRAVPPRWTRHLHRSRHVSRAMLRRARSQVRRLPSLSPRRAKS